MDENKLTRGHYIAAIGSSLFGVYGVVVEWGNNGLQRPFMWLPLMGLLVALGYVLALNAVAKRLRSPLKEWIEHGFLVLEAFLLLGFLYALIYPYEWAGLGPQLVIPFVEPAKGLWDWLQLAGVLAVPVAVVVIGYFLQLREQERTKKQAETEQKIAEDRLQDQRLQNYLDHMSELLIEKGLGREGVLDGVKTVARARTQTTLRGLDGERKALLLKFLYESDLIGGEEPKVNLTSSDFSTAHLEWAQLEGANLKRANLKRANLRGANVEGVNLEGANLEEANLKGTNLRKTNMNGANMNGANMAGSRPMWASLIGAILIEAYLPGANLTGANLEEAILREAILEQANLTEANLTGANLNGANLKGANLKGANLKRTNLVSVYMDETTILPDGSYYQPPTMAAKDTNAPPTEKPEGKA